jgi:hypothetical protein
VACHLGHRPKWQKHYGALISAFATGCGAHGFYGKKSRQIRSNCGSLTEVFKRIGKGAKKKPDCLILKAIRRSHGETLGLPPPSLQQVMIFINQKIHTH